MRIWNSSFLYKPLLSPLQAPYKHLPSNKSLRKNKTKQNKTKQKLLQEQKSAKK
ncbi:DNA replication protein DnaD [Bacillus anthracis]|uniref:DNA replication protein DnaD n=1 Tax=Bacillus anthracis TaxID=1392 RepID=UPI002541CAC6|nr:DNA replication protein DnaD [Bacillus anthracis]WIG19965.1 DNA replication protein DnaD [Bacillus anthracis]